MSQENVEIMRAAVEAFNSGDIDAVMADCDADAVLDEGGQVPDASVYRGPAEIRHYWESWYRFWDRPQMTVTDLQPIDDHHVVTVVRFSGRARSSGAPVATEAVSLVTFRDGKVVRQTYFGSVQDALEAVGLSEHDAHGT